MDGGDVTVSIAKKKGVILVDDEDAGRVLKARGVKLYIMKDGRAFVQHFTQQDIRNGVRRKLTSAYLANFLMGHPLGGNLWDHVNGNPLDNRKANLRLATPAQNARNLRLQARNKSGKAGVWFRHDRWFWTARITVDYRVMNLGAFPTRDEAIAARLAAEAKYFGEFAPSLCRSR